MWKCVDELGFPSSAVPQSWWYKLYSSLFLYFYTKCLAIMHVKHRGGGMILWAHLAAINKVKNYLFVSANEMLLSCGKILGSCRKCWFWKEIKTFLKISGSFPFMLKIFGYMTFISANICRGTHWKAISLCQTWILSISLVFYVNQCSCNKI